MGETDEAKRSVLDALPDDALHTEVRGLLLRPGTSLVTGDESSGAGFVLSRTNELAVAFGTPDERTLDALIAAARDAGVPPKKLEIHAPEAVAERWSDAGVVWPSRPAQVLAWPAGREAALDALVRHEARLLSPDDDALDTLPAHLRRELTGQEFTGQEVTGAGDWPTCAASFAGGAIASLVYAFVETETHWDLSIDTLEDFRREGFATSSAAFLILRQFERGLQPVWGANVENAASLALAARLGFEPVGMIGTTCPRVTDPGR